MLAITIVISTQRVDPEGPVRAEHLRELSAIPRIKDLAVVDAFG
jgi:hypothetical protein